MTMNERDAAEFRSANPWFDPTDYVQEWIPVYVDRNNPRRYHTEISFLLELRQ